MDTTQENLITTGQLENANALTLPESVTPDFSNLSTFYTPTQQMQEQDTEIKKAKKKQKGTLSDIFKGLNALGNKGATQIALEEEAGIPTLNKELVDIENQLRAKDLEFRREREALTIEPGLTAAQRNARLADVQRKQYSQLADLEVIRQARSNSLTNAQSLIDRKVELEFGDKLAKVDALKFLYNENKDTLSKEEDKLLNETIRREERAFNVAKGQYEKLEGAKLEFVKNASLSGASNAILQSIMSAKSLPEAIKNAGKFVANPIEIARLMETNMSIQKMTTEIAAAKAGLGKPLSGDAAKVLSIADSVQPEIERIKQAFQGNYKKSLKGIVFGTDRELAKLVDNVADKVGRLRSGGAINKEEEKRFKKQIASFMDLGFGTQAQAISALDGILTEAQQVSQGINPYQKQLEDMSNDPLGLGVSITNTNPLGI